MRFLTRHSDTIFFIELMVKTNSKVQKLIYNSECLTVYLKSKPIQNRANKELINILKKKLNISSNQIQIISGSKTQDKILKISFLNKIDEKEMIRRLLD